MTRFGLDNLRAALEAQVKAVGLRPFGRQHGVQLGVVRSILDGRDASFSNVMRLAEILDVPVGLDPPLSAEPTTVTEVNGKKFAAIARYDARAAAGGGSINFDDPPTDHLAFSKDWLEAQGIRASTALLMTVAGDSMAPTLHDGDLVMVDRARQQIRSGRVYVFNDPENGTRLKRMELLDGAGVVIRSDNPDAAAYPPEFRGGQAADALAQGIIGEVVWSAHKW